LDDALGDDSFVAHLMKEIGGQRVGG